MYETIAFVKSSRGPVVNSQPLMMSDGGRTAEIPPPPVGRTNVRCPEMYDAEASNRVYRLSKFGVGPGDDGRESLMLAGAALEARNVGQNSPAATTPLLVITVAPLHEWMCLLVPLHKLPKIEMI